jgi:predicted secreted protein
LHKFKHNSQIKHMAMSMIQVIIIIWHKISFYLLNMSVRNKLRNSKMILVNPSQNLYIKIYCDIKQTHVSVGALFIHLNEMFTAGVC